MEEKTGHPTKVKLPILEYCTYPSAIQNINSMTDKICSVE